MHIVPRIKAAGKAGGASGGGKTTVLVPRRGLEEARPLAVLLLDLCSNCIKVSRSLVAVSVDIVRERPPWLKMPDQPTRPLAPHQLLRGCSRLPAASFPAGLDGGN